MAHPWTLPQCRRAVQIQCAVPPPGPCGRFAAPPTVQRRTWTRSPATIGLGVAPNLILASNCLRIPEPMTVASLCSPLCSATRAPALKEKPARRSRRSSRIKARNEWLVVSSLFWNSPFCSRSFFGGGRRSVLLFVEGGWEASRSGRDVEADVMQTVPKGDFSSVRS